MEVQDLLKGAESVMTAGRVFGEPYEKDGITVIPAAALRAGGGGGRGEPRGELTRGTGTGGGFGLMAKPIGAYVIKDGRVSWRPALDLNRLLSIAGAVFAGALFAFGAARRPRRMVHLPRIAARGGVFLRFGKKAGAW